MKVTAIIPARAGSKGIPHKNTAICGGRALIDWTIEAAVGANLINNTIVSTDDLLIKAATKITKWRSVRLDDRPEHLAGDDVSTEAVLEYVVNRVARSDIYVLLQPTSPVRTADQIDEAIQLLIDEKADSLLSVVPSHAFLWWADSEGVSQSSYNFVDRPLRQDMHQFEENGSIYAFTRRQWGLGKNRLGGKIILYEMPEESRIQIDTPLDLLLVDTILKQKAA